MAKKVMAILSMSILSIYMIIEAGESLSMWELSMSMMAFYKGGSTHMAKQI